MPERWWIYADRRTKLFERINSFDRVVAMAVVSKIVQPVIVPSNHVVLNKVVLFCYDDDAHFGLLTSTFHWWWAVAYASTLETLLRAIAKVYAARDPNCRGSGGLRR